MDPAVHGEPSVLEILRVALDGGDLVESVTGKFATAPVRAAARCGVSNRTGGERPAPSPCPPPRRCEAHASGCPCPPSRGRIARPVRTSVDSHFCCAGVRKFVSRTNGTGRRPGGVAGGTLPPRRTETSHAAVGWAGSAACRRRYVSSAAENSPLPPQDVAEQAVRTRPPSARIDSEEKVAVTRGDAVGVWDARRVAQRVLVIKAGVRDTRETNFRVEAHPGSASPPPRTEHQGRRHPPSTS